MPRFIPRIIRNLCRLPFRTYHKVRRNRIRTLLYLFALLCLIVWPLAYIIYKPPTFVIRLFQRHYPDVLWRIDTDQKIIALTIDDAPSEYTTDILSILKENNATATFFVIGHQVTEGGGRGEKLREIIRQGSELGNHAYRDEESRSLEPAILKGQVEKVDRMILKAYGDAEVEREQKYFRPGSGFVSDAMRTLLKELRYQIVLGSIYPHDPQIHNWKINAKHIESMAKPGGVIICHDRRGWTVPMLREVLPYLGREGYEVVSVSEMLKRTGRIDADGKISLG